MEAPIYSNQAGQIGAVRTGGPLQDSAANYTQWQLNKNRSQTNQSQVPQQSMQQLEDQFKRRTTHPERSGVTGSSSYTQNMPLHLQGRKKPASKISLRGMRTQTGFSVQQPSLGVA